MTPARILIVEDEVIAAMAIHLTLAQVGHTVLDPAGDGAEALALAEAQPPAVALVDINLPGALDGIGTAALLKRRFGCAIIFFTGLNDGAARERAAAVPHVAILSKPIRRAALMTALALALGERDGGPPDAA
jgi:CheY-like chemotaxis protein